MVQCQRFKTLMTGHKTARKTRIVDRALPGFERFSKPKTKSGSRSLPETRLPGKGTAETCRPGTDDVGK